MEIRHYIRQDCPRVTADTRVDDVYDAVNKSKCAIVFQEDGTVVGVLGAADMHKCTGGRIGHCHVEKPIIDAGATVTDAIALMADEGTDVLLVYEGDTFLGIVSIYDLALQLHSRLDKKSTT